ncbi:hypothetical protein BDW66DRAFT_143612, partial [Aspergillus desertorum]
MRVTRCRQPAQSAALKESGRMTNLSKAQRTSRQAATGDKQSKAEAVPKGQSQV